MSVRRVDAATAAAALAGLERLDPRGLMTSADMVDACKAANCFQVEGDAKAFYVVGVRNGVAWIEAAQGSGSIDLSAALDALICSQADGLRAVGFSTARPGLVRKAQRRGYVVTGWILQKALT